MGLVRGKSRLRHQLVRAHRGAPEHERRVRRHLWLCGRAASWLHWLPVLGCTPGRCSACVCSATATERLATSRRCARGYGWSVRGAPFASLGLASRGGARRLAPRRRTDDMEVVGQLGRGIDLDRKYGSCHRRGSLGTVDATVGTVAQDVRSLWRLHGLWRALVAVHPDVRLVRSSLTMRPRVRLVVASLRSALPTRDRTRREPRGLSRCPSASGGNRGRTWTGSGRLGHCGDGRLCPDPGPRARRRRLPAACGRRTRFRSLVKWLEDVAPSSRVRVLSGRHRPLQSRARGSCLTRVVVTTNISTDRACDKNVGRKGGQDR